MSTSPGFGKSSRPTRQCGWRPFMVWASDWTVLVGRPSISHKLTEKVRICNTSEIPMCPSPFKSAGHVSMESKRTSVIKKRGRIGSPPLPVQPDASADPQGVSSPAKRE